VLRNCNLRFYGEGLSDNNLPYHIVVWFETIWNPKPIAEKSPHESFYLLRVATGFHLLQTTNVNCHHSSALVNSCCNSRLKTASKLDCDNYNFQIQPILITSYKIQNSM
jgi:hypothetical protein